MHSDFPSFQAGLLQQLPVTEVCLAPWRKSRNARATALQLTFKQEIPPFVKIPGEQAWTPVYEVRPQPMLCKTCLAFGHTAKHCRGTLTCKKCNTMGHSVDACTSPILMCHHCGGAHMTGSSTCVDFKYELELFALQTNLRIPRGQAKLQFDRECPNFRTTNYKQALLGSQHSSSANPMTTIPQPAVNDIAVQPAAASTGITNSHPVNDTQSKGAPAPETEAIQPSGTSMECEDDLTATKRMFNEHSTRHPPAQSDVPSLSDTQADVQSYERDLQKTQRKHKSHRSHTPPQKKRDRHTPSSHAADRTHSTGSSPDHSRRNSHHRHRPKKQKI